MSFTQVGSGLLTNIRLGWKGVPRANTIAYYEHEKITGVKSFITLGLETSRNFEIGRLPDGNNKFGKKLVKKSSLSKTSTSACFLKYHLSREY